MCQLPPILAARSTEYIERQVHWDRLASLADQPLVTLEQTYGWARISMPTFLRSLGILARGFGGRAGLYPADRELIDQYFASGSCLCSKRR
jgi:hypothetical protein